MAIISMLYLTKGIKLIDNYNIYHYNKNELSALIIQGIFLCILLGYLFYNNILGVLVLLPFTFLNVKNKKTDYVLNRKWQLTKEFKDGLSSLIAALNAGYSVENAISQAANDLKQMHEKESLIITEFDTIVSKLQMNQNTEEVFHDFGERSDVEDIKNFADVFKTAKRTGGDIIRIMRSTEKTINDKIEVESEIQTLIAGKRLEVKIMNGMPCGIILFLRVSSPGFLDPLYGNLSGVLIMSAILAIYYGITKATEKLTDIRV